MALGQPPAMAPTTSSGSLARHDLVRQRRVPALRATDLPAGEEADQRSGAAWCGRGSYLQHRVSASAREHRPLRDRRVDGQFPPSLAHPGQRAQVGRATTRIMAAAVRHFHREHRKAESWTMAVHVSPVGRGVDLGPRRAEVDTACVEACRRPGRCAALT